MYALREKCSLADQKLDRKVHDMTLVGNAVNKIPLVRANISFVDRSNCALCALSNLEHMEYKKRAVNMINGHYIRSVKNNPKHFVITFF